jgi:hypothetical protein
MMDARVKPAHDDVLHERETKAPPGGDVRTGLLSLGRDCGAPERIIRSGN